MSEEINKENADVIYYNGHAFLSGGGHNVLKYITGEISPSQESIDNFKNNIDLRRIIINDLGKPYFHVIFPDKQSVLREYFPNKDIIMLGNVYLSSMNEEIKSHVIYPVEELRALDREAFLRIDTHLSDDGSLEVLRILSERLDLEVGSALAHVQTRINRKVTSSGDLGSKLVPEVFQEFLRLDPDWTMHLFRGPTMFNEGVFDICINKSAPVDKTLLIFGDSFFRLMIPCMSAVFSRIVFLRTRYFHREMVTAIEPDIVLSGNAERYLSSVSNDRNAVPFFLYPYLRSGEGPMETALRDAYRAMLSPRSDFSRAWLAGLA